MVDIDSLTSYIGKEWQAVSAAPALFIAAAVTIGAVVWAFLSRQFRIIIEQKQATIDHYKDRPATAQIENTKPSKDQPADKPVPEEPGYLKIMILGAGQAPDKTTPVVLVAEAQVTTDRLRILVEHSSYQRALNWAGWMHPRQVLLEDLNGVIRGDRIQLSVVSCNSDGGEMWWGRENKVPGDLIHKFHRYRAKLRFVGNDGAEQSLRFFLTRTSAADPPHIVEVFTEHDFD
jgi:hypothetical protein